MYGVVPVPDVANCMVPHNRQEPSGSSIRKLAQRLASILQVHLVVDTSSWSTFTLVSSDMIFMFTYTRLLLVGGSMRSLSQ